jgi:hypothetical protein
MPAKERKILAVVRDNGGTNNLMPAIMELKRRGHQVRIGANGAAAEFIPARGIEFTPLTTAEETLEKFSAPDLLITSMCSGGGVGRDLVPLLRNICPTVAVQDYWGAYLITDWVDPQYRPDRIIVNDQLGADIVKKAWPEFELNRVCQTGFPMFDKYSDITPDDESNASNEIRTKLNTVTGSGSIIIFFPCGTWNGASELLCEVLKAVATCTAKTSCRLYLIPRAHPALKEHAPHEFEPWNNAIAKFNREYPGIVVTNQTVVRGDLKKLLLASDIVISDWSTTLLEAGLVGAKLNGKVNISAIYSPTLVKEFRKSAGTLMTEPPYVTLGCTAKAYNQTGLVNLILFALAGHLTARLTMAQKKYLVADGKNGSRAADLVESLL